MKRIAFLLLIVILCSCVPSTPESNAIPASPTSEVIPPTDTLAPPTNTPIPDTATPTSTPPIYTPTPTGPEWPSARKYGAMVYDPVSEFVFMFGGVEWYGDATDIPEVWAYDTADNTWWRKSKLGPRSVVSASIDEESQRIIIFGRGDTWAYNPTDDTWQQMNPATMPSKRWGSVMAYDAESDRIVFFGGGTSQKDCYDDTWVYDYNTDTWTEMQPDISPPQRGYHNMAYDPGSDRIILWGGTIDADALDFRVWLYDYNTNIWSDQELPVQFPEDHRAGFGMFYHEASRKLIVYGGLEEADGHLMEEITWVYDFQTLSWEAHDLIVNAGKRAFFPMTYASSIDKAVLFGGELANKKADEISDETWLFDLGINEWQKINKP